MNRLEGLYNITNWDETTFSEGEGGKQSLAVVTQEYSGDIEGSSELRYIIVYETNSAPVFVGVETIKAKIDGKEGTLVLQHNGKFENGVASADFIIINATAELAGMTGTGSFESGEKRQAKYLIAYSM